MVSGVDRVKGRGGREGDGWTEVGDNLGGEEDGGEGVDWDDKSKVDNIFCCTR